MQSPRGSSKTPKLGYLAVTRRLRVMAIPRQLHRSGASPSACPSMQRGVPPYLHRPHTIVCRARRCVLSPVQPYVALGMMIGVTPRAHEQHIRRLTNWTCAPLSAAWTFPRLPPRPDIPHPLARAAELRPHLSGCQVRLLNVPGLTAPAAHGRAVLGWHAANPLEVTRRVWREMQVHGWVMTLRCADVRFSGSSTS